jgi:hypothetical protein
MAFDRKEPESVDEFLDLMEEEQDEERYPSPGGETPEADAAEQHRELRARTAPPPERLPDDADPADAADQARVVDIDDDYDR